MHPQIEAAPGLRWQRRRDGTCIAVWRARKDLVAKGFRPKNQILWRGLPHTLGSDGVLRIQNECARLQNEMLAWSRGGRPEGARDDGTFGALIDLYQTDPDSSYHHLTYHTRDRANAKLRRLKRDAGGRQRASLTFRDFKTWYTNMRWPEGPDGRERTGGAYGMMTHVRILIRFGAMMELPECERLAGVLSQMRFENSRPRTSELTAQMAAGIIAKAHENGLPSVALVQALQFDLMLRQKDVLGEWVPMREPGLSQYAWRGKKWLYGMRWDEISADLVLRHPLSKSRGRKVVEFDLKLYPMVMAEIARIPLEERTGAVVKDEKNGLPWQAWRFRRVWRKIATAAGVPADVWNMDSRAGAITEATEAAGGELDSVRHHAGHASLRMTQRYSRGAVRKTAKIATLRAEFRKQDSGS